MTKTQWIQFLSLALLLSGCSYNPFSSDNHLTGKPVGAVIGTTAGMGAAALASASKPMVALAGVGGAAFGYYVTTLDFAAGGLKRAGGHVFTQGNCVTITLPTYRLFDSNSADLLPEAHTALSSAAQVLNYYPDNDIMISGNSSGFGTQRDERRLTRRRAKEVAGYLWAHGISALRCGESIQKRELMVVGYGHHFPVANSIEANGIRANSRIQISACPNAKELRANITTVTDANVGRTETIEVAKTDARNDFKRDKLPETPNPTPDPFQPPIQDTKTAWKQTDLKREINQF